LSFTSHDLALTVGLEDLDHVHGVVQDHLHARQQRDSSISGVAFTRILRPEVNTSIVPSSLAPRNTPNDAGGCESFSTSARVPRSSPSPRAGVGELLVLAHRPREVLAGLDQLLLEDRDLAGGVGEAPAQQRDLVLQELHLGLEFMGLLLVLLDVLRVAHLVHLPERPWYTRLPTDPGCAPIR
jgi:hypothetical protein